MSKRGADHLIVSPTMAQLPKKPDGDPVYNQNVICSLCNCSCFRKISTKYNHNFFSYFANKQMLSIT